MILSAKLSSRSKLIESLSLKNISLSFIFTEIVTGLSPDNENSSSISVFLSFSGKTPFLKQLLIKRYNKNIFTILLMTHYPSL